MEIQSDSEWESDHQLMGMWADVSPVPSHGVSQHQHGSEWRPVNTGLQGCHPSHWSFLQVIVGAQVAADESREEVVVDGVTTTVKVQQ